MPLMVSHLHCSVRLIQMANGPAVSRHPKVALCECMWRQQWSFICMHMQYRDVPWLNRYMTHHNVLVRTLVGRVWSPSVIVSCNVNND